MNIDMVELASVPTGSKRRFWGHFAEMVVVMLLSMAILGAAVSGVFALAGHSNLLHYAALRGLLMTGYMVAGMALWMRHRRHGWASVREMSAAMTVPYIVLLGPFLAGAIPEGSFLAAMHVLMVPSMYVAMARRREEYELDHKDHHRRGDRQPVHHQGGSSWQR
jgi:flagellar biosynthetic protein FliP